MECIGFGNHFDADRQMPQCMIGGNMCDDCWVASRQMFRAEMDKILEDTLIANGILKPKPKIDIVQFPEIKDIEGVASVYELTLTTTKDDPYELRQYFQKIYESKMFDVKAFKACMELQKNGNPHIHAMLWSGKRVLNSNHIKSKIKFPYIFSLKFVRRQENFYNYILKSEKNNNIEDIDYCNRKGIPQQWSSQEKEAENILGGLDQQ